MAVTEPILDVLILDQPEQLKALGHPLRLRVLEMLGTSGEDAITNRELANKLGVDPGHLHFHVRMLLRAGLITLVDTDRKSTRLNSSHSSISYAVFCLKKKKK